MKLKGVFYYVDIHLLYLFGGAFIMSLLGGRNGLPFFLGIMLIIVLGHAITRSEHNSRIIYFTVNSIIALLYILLSYGIILLMN